MFRKSVCRPAYLARRPAQKRACACACLHSGGVLRRPLFCMRQTDAAKKLGIAPSTLKQVCRKLGVGRWPWRDQKYKRDRSSAPESSEASASAVTGSSSSSPAAAAGGSGQVDDVERYAEYLQSLGGPAGQERPLAALRPEPTEASGAGADSQPGWSGDGAGEGKVEVLPRVRPEIWEAVDRNSRGLLDEALRSI